MVCDYLGGELRGYVRHDRRAAGRRVGRSRRSRSCSATGYLAITFDQPVPSERYQGIVPLEGKNLGEAAQSYFAQSEQIPSLVRLAAEKRDGHWFAGGLLLQHLPEGEEGRERLHTRLDHPDWPHVAILGGSVKAEELTDPELPLDDLHLAPVPRGGRGAHAGRDCRSRRGCRCDPDYVRSVIARFPAERARGDGRRRRPDPGRLRLLLVELRDRADASCSDGTEIHFSINRLA